MARSVKAGGYTLGIAIRNIPYFSSVTSDSRLMYVPFVPQ